MIRALNHNRETAQHKMDSDWKHYFEAVGNNPGYWQMSGDSLLVASNVLRDSYRDALSMLLKAQPRQEIRILGPSLLLLGQRIERYLKANWLKQGHKLIVGGHFDKAMKQHNLIPLAGRIDLKLDQGRRVVLERLSYYVTAAGRYPIPLSYEPMVPRSWANGAFGQSYCPMSWIGGHDQAASLG
jgi:hypothetical protein